MNDERLAALAQAAGFTNWAKLDVSTIALKQEGDYQTAIDLFMLLGDYLSSADQAVECKTYLRDAEYDQADALEASGDLQGAYDLFSSLSGYRDAAQRAENLAAQLGIQ